MAKRNLPLGGAIPMEPGERDRAVTIQQLTESVAGTSKMPKENWTTLVATVWMRRLDLRQRENFRADQITAPAEAQWEMGYRADMDPELVDVAKVRRLVYQGRTYEITEASMIGRRDGIELTTLANGSGS